VGRNGPGRCGLSVDVTRSRSSIAATLQQSAFPLAQGLSTHETCGKCVGRTCRGEHSSGQNIGTDFTVSCSTQAVPTNSSGLCLSGIPFLSGKCHPAPVLALKGTRAHPEDQHLYDHATLTPENPPQSHLICHIGLAFVRRWSLPAIVSTSNRRRAVATPLIWSTRPGSMHRHIHRLDCPTQPLTH